MMRSLYSGVAGLRTHQTKMDVLGNNIANVNTTSFKSQSITFSDLMYQTTQTASGATETKGGVNARQIGLGAKSGAIATAIESQGATQTTNNPFDIMITGKSFFVVNNGKDNLYTRDGSFYIDGAGNLAMQANGYLVQGWVAQEDKETGEIKVNKNGGLSSLQIMSADNSTYSPASTTAALYSGNIDDHDTNVTSDDGKTITLEFYDNKGYLYTGKFNLKDTGTEHLFSLELTDIIDSDGNSINKTLTDGTKVLDHVTLGDVEKTSNIEVQKGYRFVKATDSTGTIYQEKGAPAFENVPLRGTDFSELTDIPGFISKVFPTITDTSLYSNIKTYELGQETLDIVYDYTSYSGSLTSNIYSSFTLENSNPYFYNSSNKGYPAPTTETGSLKDLNTTMLSTIYPSTATYSAFSTSPKKFDFNFNSKTGDLKITAASSALPETTTTKEKTNSLTSGKYDDFFTNISGTTKVSQAVSTVPTGYKSTLYDFDGTNLKVYGVKEVAGTASQAGLKATSANTALFAEFTSKTTGTISQSDISSNASAYAKLKEIAENTTPSRVPIKNLSELGTINVSRGTDLSGNLSYIVSFGTPNHDVPIDSSDATMFAYLGTLSYTGDAATFTSADISGAAATRMTEIATNEQLTEYTITYAVNSSKTGYTLTYTNNADTSKVYTADTNAATDTALINYIDSQTVTTMNYSSLSAAAKAEFETILNDPNFDKTQDATITITQHSLTGTNGYVMKVDYETLTDNSDDVLATFKTFNETFSPTTGYDIGTPDSVFKSSTGEAYVLNDDNDDGKYTLDELVDQLGESVIKELYGVTSINDLKKGATGKMNDEFTVSFTSAGYITVSYEKEDQIKKSTKYDIVPDYTNNTVKVVTAEDTILYPDQEMVTTTAFKLNGNISDLLTSATGELKGLLKSVYGISDDDARAYGSAGKYSIDPTSGKLTLTTGDTDTTTGAGNKTIMMRFDAANGSLVDANGQKTGLVNLVFNQETKGLEAFGYQKQPSDGDDAVLGRMTIDFSTVTNYNTSGSSTIKAVKGDKKSLNTGRAVGEMNGVTVSTDGQIYATYSNGQTKLLGQIASAEFANASGLSKEGDNLYSSTLNSGDPTIQDITTDGGYMNTGVLEMSNVDLSKEFTEMITTQRGFQANSRIITVSDTLLEELTNLKR